VGLFEHWKQGKETKKKKRNERVLELDDGGTTLSLLGSDRGLRCGTTTTPVREKWGVQDTASGGHAFCQRQDDAL
jgi:hypothetical protein